MQQKTETQQLQQDIADKLSKVKNNYSRHIINLHQTSNGNVLMVLHTEQSKQYDGLQSRPDAKICLAVHEALKDLDGDMHRVLWSEGTDSDGILVETRPFDREREREVL